MKRDMELIRKILFAIENQYKAGEVSMWGVKIEGYDMPIVAEHCDLLYQQGLIKSYEPIIGGDVVQAFRIGNLTYFGYDYLELIRDDKVWEKTNTEIEEKKLPKTIEEIAKIAGIFMGNVLKEFTDR
jgi:hypothetical protein